jgi:glycosyltransferase involved in cell wall biosynthesis
MFHPADSNANPIPISTAKDELGIEGPIALTFGFVEKKKRYEDIIRALPECPDLIYLIAGGFRENEGKVVWKRCQELASELCVTDRIRHIGYVDDDEVATVFSAADVVILPYERVSQSGVVNDALAYHRPVITSSLPSFEELRTEYGCLLTYDTVPELISQLDKILSNSIQRNMLEQRSKNYVQNISWTQFSRRTNVLYDSVQYQR